MVDGRSVYNPDFSYVSWNLQNVLLEDVERIEVIRGPGGTLWGANAVNGVINIITKSAKDTQGAYAMAGGGTQDRDREAVRYGGHIGEDLYFRVYGQHFDEGPGYVPGGAEPDAWRQGQCGFRADWQPNHGKTDTLTVQGDHYQGCSGDQRHACCGTEALPANQMGENVLARWRHVNGEDSDWQLQTYYDKFSDIVPATNLNETVKTFDVDFQIRFPLGQRQKITCGAGYRNVESYVPGTDGFVPVFPTPNFTSNYTSQFIQDEIAVVEDRLTFTLGVKLDENPYVGLEYEPTARLLYAPDNKHSFWGAISRAVHTPSRVDEQGQLSWLYLDDAVFRLYGNENLVAENMMAYEIGYREQTTDKFSWDIATYYNVYKQLMALIIDYPGIFPEPTPLPPHYVVPVLIANTASADTYGVELSANYEVTKGWRLYGQYTVFEMMVNGLLEVSAGPGYSPHNQIYLKSSWDLRENLEFDIMARYVDALTILDVPSYITMDARLAWRPARIWNWR